MEFERGGLLKHTQARMAPGNITLWPILAIRMEC